MSSQPQFCPEAFECLNPNCALYHRNGRRIEQTFLAQAQLAQTRPAQTQIPQQQQIYVRQQQSVPQQAYVSPAQYVVQQPYASSAPQQQHQSQQVYYQVQTSQTPQSNYPSLSQAQQQQPQQPIQQSQQQNLYYYTADQQSSYQYDPQTYSQYSQDYDEDYYQYDEYGYPYMTEEQQQYYQQYQQTQKQQPQQKAAQDCRYGVKCHRRDCFYNHPQGRLMDRQESKSSAPQVDELASALRSTSLASSEEPDFDVPDFEDESEPACACCLDKPFDCKNAQCSLQGLCNCMLKNFQDEEDLLPEDHFEEEDEESWKDEWFPSSANCACCHGYIFKCAQQNETCKKGKCSCSGAPAPTVNTQEASTQPQAQSQPSWANVAAPK